MERRGAVAAAARAGRVVAARLGEELQRSQDAAAVGGPSGRLQRRSGAVRLSAAMRAATAMSSASAVVRGKGRPAGGEAEGGGDAQGEVAHHSKSLAQ